MKKKKFTSEDIVMWQQEFYAQGENEKKQQIRVLQQSFRPTLKSIFDFTTDQEEWLDALDDEFIFVLSNQLAVTLTLELPIRLVKPEKPSSEVGMMGVKRGESHNPITSTAVAGHAPVSEGEFVFTISY